MAPALLAALPLVAGCAMHVGSGSSVIRAAEPIPLGESFSDVSAALRSYELDYQIQVPYAVTILGASVVKGDGRARETVGDSRMLSSSDLTAWHAKIGIALPLPEVKGLRLAPYGTYSRRFMPMDEPSLSSTTEVGLQILPREPWGFFGDDMRQGFAARVGLCWAAGEFDGGEWEDPAFKARGLLFAIDYRLLFAEQEKWEL